MTEPRKRGAKKQDDMKLFKYKVRWSPYSTSIHAKSREDADRLIRKQYPHAKGDFYMFL